MKRQFCSSESVSTATTGVEGDTYNGMFFIQALQRMNSEEAVRMAAKVAPFFWVDAPRVVVWLCKQCATELSLVDSRAIMKAGRVA
jgi:hypothetical protein